MIFKLCVACYLHQKHEQAMAKNKPQPRCLYYIGLQQKLGRKLCEEASLRYIYM